MVVPIGTLNASVLFSPLSCKELGVESAIHPGLGENHFSWVDRNLHWGAGGQFPVVWLLEGNDANTNPGFSSWEIQEASPRSGGGRRMFVKVPVLPCPHINELSPLFLLDSEEYSSSAKPRRHWQAKATVFSNLPGSKPGKFGFCEESSLACWINQID